VPHNALFASPDQVARGILKAIERRRDVAYVPWFWAGIMLLVRLIPGSRFKKMNM
jgi:short-subunit dehydrogenase